MARADRSRVIVGTGNVANTYSVIDLTANTTIEPMAKAIPDICRLAKLEVEITAIASSAATLTWYLAKDSGGDYGLTPAVATTILVGKTTNTRGSINAAIDLPHTLTANGVTGHVYLVIKSDTGTCTVSKAILSWVN